MTLGRIDFLERIFRESSLMQETLIWKGTDQRLWAVSANWDWAQEHVFFLGAKIKKNNTLRYKCVSLIDVTQKEKEQGLCVHCYLHVIRLIFLKISFYCMGLYALPFAFVDLWKHTGEIHPNVAHPKTGLHPLSLFFRFRETWSALTSRSPTPDSVHPRLRKRSAQLCACATGPTHPEASREALLCSKKGL